jgi:hypothetical protein
VAEKLDNRWFWCLLRSAIPGGDFGGGSSSLPLEAEQVEPLQVTTSFAAFVMMTVSVVQNTHWITLMIGSCSSSWQVGKAIGAAFKLTLYPKP